MRERRDHTQRLATSRSTRQSPDRRPEIRGSERIHIRNYDHRWGYDLAIEAVDASGEVVYEKRYYLQPGQVESEQDALPDGEYEIRVTLDNRQASDRQCRIDTDPSHTAVVEVGNGALSLTEGRFV